jgi:hypothetical protein
MRTRGVTHDLSLAASPLRGAARRRRALRLLLAALLVPGCSGKTENPVAPEIHPVPAVTFQQLRDAPENLKFDGVTFTVDVELWRDFMPPAPADGRPLAARAVVTAENTGAYPANITSAYVWVVSGGVFWASWMEETGAPPGAPNARIYRADGGPLWGPNVLVDVVVGLRTSGANLHLVQIPDVVISRTD